MDDEGRTPLPDLTKDHQMIQLLLKHGARVNNVYKRYSSLLGKLASEHPPDNSVHILFMGDSGAGTTTLINSMLSSRSFKPTSKMVSWTGINEKTVGIITHHMITKKFGRVICYDFAGHQGFYASHCAVLENIVQTSSPIIIYVARLQESKQRIAESTVWWMTLVQNKCTNLTGKAYIIIVGSHADKMKEIPQDKKSMFAPIIKRFSQLEFIMFTPMDCRSLHSDQMKQVTKQVQEYSAAFRPHKTVSLNAHAFFSYLQDSFKAELAISLNDVQQKIHSDLEQTPSKEVKNLLTFIPSTLHCLLEICDQLNKKGLILYLHNESLPENSFIICDPFALLSVIIGRVFAPEDFHQHCRLATDTGVVSLSNFSKLFKYDTHKIIAIMKLLKLCLEINALEHIADRYLFFPGLIRIKYPRESMGRGSG